MWYNIHMERKNTLMTGEIYHVFTRSIADFKVFNVHQDYERMLKLFYFFQVEKSPIKFSNFINAKNVQQIGFRNSFDSLMQDHDKIIQIIGYCLMPTHIHLILRQLKNNGISIFMGNILNSYSRYFNTLHKRKGPLWESKFQNILVKDDEQLLHLTRYIHLNPVTVLLVRRPEDWKYSSYLEYLGLEANNLCSIENLINMYPDEYKKFVCDRIDYQRELARIKKIILES